MKTVIDAVNEKIMNAVSKLEGELLTAVYANTHKSNYKKSDVFLHKVLTNRFDPTPVGGFVIYSSDESDRDDVEFICTTFEFIATVAECETNFGECDLVNVSHYKLADKVLLTKDLDKELDVDIDIWENAPEGATHLAMGSGSFPAYYYKLASDGLMMSNEYTDGWVHSCNANSWLINNDSLIAKPQATPIFTQEMADNDVLPSVGHSFIVGNEVESDSRTIDFKGLEVEVIGLSKLDDDTVITFSHPTMGIGCGVYFESWVKPLTPPKTDKEKAIDEYIESQHHGLDSLSQSIKTIMKNAFEAGVSFQPLTVEAK